MRMSGRQNKQAPCNYDHVFRLFCLSFIVFGTGLCFIGFIGDDSLLGSVSLICLLSALAFIISLFATAKHVEPGLYDAVNVLADKL